MKQIQTAVPYYLPLSVALTGAAGETVLGETNAASAYDLNVLGGVTDLKTSRAAFSVGRRLNMWSSDKIPMTVLFGQIDSPRQVSHWVRPLPLNKGQKLATEVLNSNGEGAGNIVFVCEQAGVQMPVLTRPHEIGEMGVIAVDSQFTGVLNESPDPIATVQSGWDFVLYGFNTDLATATVRITGCDGRRWMSDFTPIWAIAGRPTSASPTMLLNRPYVIPANQTMEFEFRNDGTEAAGLLYLYGQWIPKQQQG